MGVGGGVIRVMTGWLIKLMMIIIVIIIDHYIPFFASIPLQIFKIFFASGGKGVLTP